MFINNKLTIKNSEMLLNYLPSPVRVTLPIPRVSLITSVFKGDQYIKHFLQDITRQTVFSQCELILINPNSQGKEEIVILEYLAKYSNIIYKRLDYDPGLYEVWNMAIRMAQGEYITNANLDDRKSPEYLEKHIQALEQNPDVDVVCAPLKVTKLANETWENNSAYATWYDQGFPEYFSTKDLFQEEWKDGVKTGKIMSCNIPHCMPVWRKRLHEKNGYFDEPGYGTIADWEFWLRCSVNGAKFQLLTEPLGLYFENPASHNRTYANKESFEEKIINYYYYPMKNLEYTLSSSVSHKIPLNKYPRKINLTSALEFYYGTHRSGIAYALNSLKDLHRDDGILLDGFIEKKFCWGSDPGDFHNNPQPYQEPWIGFIHCPHNSPRWFQYHLTPQSIFKTQMWQDSLKFCQGIFCLSDYHKRWLKKHTDVPVVSLFHPTEVPNLKFSMDKFLSNPEKKIIQVGWWLRKLHSIYYLPVKKIKKAILRPHKYSLDDLFETEKNIFNLHPDYDSVQRIEYIPDAEYDQLLSQNIVYLDLYDSSANNAIIECIVRNTPVLVNPLPAVKEYLGEDYPFYFEDRQEAAQKAEDYDLIEKTFNYLKSSVLKENLTENRFIESLVTSEIYLGLPG